MRTTRSHDFTMAMRSNRLAMEGLRRLDSCPGLRPAGVTFFRRNDKEIMAARRSPFFSRGYSPLTFGVERIVDDELSRQNLMIAKTQGGEAVGDPAQTFAGRVRI